MRSFSGTNSNLQTTLLLIPSLAAASTMSLCCSPFPKIASFARAIFSIEKLSPSHQDKRALIRNK
jgi:hypothetical protein